MKIGLASYEFRNNDITFNLLQIERVMQSVQGSVELLCFGETFLQGFDALNWNYAHDRDIAILQDSDFMQRLCLLTIQYGVDLSIGYIERTGDRLFSSYAVIENGKIIHNYRRISLGWKEVDLADDHYCEGVSTNEFFYHGQKFKIALCGDLWDYPERFATDGILIWPIYVNFSPEEWAACEGEYAEQAKLAAHRTLMINSITKDPISHGGAFFFIDGIIEKQCRYDMESILYVDIPE